MSGFPLARAHPRATQPIASGLVTFAGLTPGTYDLSVTPPGGYVTLYDTVSPKPPAHVQLSPGQTWPTSLYIYKPATIYVQLKNTDGTTYTGTATVTVSYERNSTPYSQDFPYTGNTLTIASMTEGTNTVQVIPGLSYTVSVSGGVTATPVTANVPDAYPTTLTHTFAVTVTPVQLATVRVNVTVPQWSWSLWRWVCVASTNTAVTLSGGPGPINVQGTTDSNGMVTLANVPVGGGYSITSSIQSLSNQSVIAGTNAFSLSSC